MDAVNAFNQELFSLMDMKPPISRAKMILITKAAIKAIKLYKHVVQIVEKFIKKCKPEYKVPGLYVIDSIVRQSRHQFGIDKDVFGPRFTKNLTATFQCLYLCPSEDKSKIVRVLNLWQKNGVFRIEIIQPLLDMAAGAVPAAELAADNSANEEGSSPPPIMMQTETMENVSNPDPGVSVPQLPSSDAFAAVAQLFQSTQGQQLQQILQTFQQPPKPQSPAIDENVLAQVQAITSHLSAPSHQPDRKTAFDKLLDRFDYDDEPEATEEPKKESSSPPTTQPTFSFPGDGVQSAAFTQVQGQLPNMEQFQQRIMGIPQEPIHPQAQLPSNGQTLGFGMIPAQPFTTMPPPTVSQTSSQTYPNPFQMPPNEIHVQKEHQQEVPMDVEQPSVHDKRPMSERQKSASRSPKRRRSRSNSRSRRSRHRRSRSRDRRRHSPKSRSQERRDREKDRERRLKGLPPVKSEAVSVCSTTLWVGQLDKRTSQQDVANLLEEFGAIESINMIPPRGCAYIVMVHRLDAYRALQKLSRGNYKVNQKSIKIAWALNKGIKADYKQYWDVEIGVTYVPWSKVKPDELQTLCEGGMLDNETLCPEWKGFNKKMESNDVSQNGAVENTRSEETPAASQPVPLLSVPIRAPMAGMPLPPHQPMSAHQPITPITALPPQALPLVPPQTSAAVHHPGLPPPQGLTLPQGVPPPQGMPIPQGMHHPQGVPLPQGMPVPQGMPPHQPVPGVGALQPPTFTGPISIPPPGFAPGVPPPPFMRPGFNPMQMPPGFLPPPGLPPPMAPVTIPPPAPAMNIPTSAAGAPSSDSAKDQSHGNAIQSGRENNEFDDNADGFGSPPQGGPSNTSGPMNTHHGAAQTGPHQGPPSGPHQGPPSGPHQGPPSGPHQGPPSGPHQGPPSGPHQGPPSGPHQGPPSGPHQGPPSGPHQRPPGPGMGLQPPSTGLLGARPGMIPLQRPPGVPSSHMQRFPSMPHRQMPPHMMHRGPPPGPGGYGMPPPHGMRGPFPPQGHFPRQGGPGGHGAPDEREGRQFRNDRQGFDPDRERFGRRPYGNRNEDERECFGNRLDERDHERPGSRGRRSWGRGSPDHERNRDSEERSRWSMGREREPHRPMQEMQENKHEAAAETAEEQRSFAKRTENVDKTAESEKAKEDSESKPAEEAPPTVPAQTEKDSGTKTESPC